MSSSGLDRAAIKLLLACLEARTPILSAAAQRRYASEAASLKAAGYLKPAGHEAIGTASADDTPVQLTWSPDGTGYGYFSDSDGWVQVEGENTQCLSVDMLAVIGAIAAGLELPKSNHPLKLVEGHLWEIGPARLGSRPTRTPILFGRRLRNGRVWNTIREAMIQRPSEQRRVLLTTTPPHLLPPAPSRCQFLSVENLLQTGCGLAVDPGLISARLYEASENDAGKELIVLGEGKEVRFRGETYVFKKGPTQRRIIVLLYEHYLEGQRWTSSEKILEDLDLDSTKRIRDVFKKSPAWGKLLTEKKGMCGFCFDRSAA